MAVSALANFTLSPHPYATHIPKFSLATTQNSFRSTHNLSSSSSSLCYHRQQPVRKLHVSPKPFLLASLSPPHKNISKFFVENIVTILLGSLIFMGCLKSRPVLAYSDLPCDSSQENRDDIEEAVCMNRLEEDPDSIEALKTAVKVKMRRGKTSEAAEYSKRLIQLQPDEMEWRILRASCYDIMGDLNKSKSLFMKILKRNPLYVGALHGLAMVMLKNHEEPAVFEMLEKALELARRKRRVSLELNIRTLVAQMHLMKGDVEVAKEEFQALIKENPTDFRLYVCQGIIYTIMDKRKEAAEYFEMYRKLVPEEHHLKTFLDNAVQFAEKGTKED